MVGIGGVFGGLCRFQLGKVISQQSDTAFPIGTFVINITGAFLLGVLTSIDVGNRPYLLLGDGFLGAYTTFSTFMYEEVHLIQESEKLHALAYLLGTLFFGMIGYVCGYAIGKRFLAF